MVFRFIHCADLHLDAVLRNAHRSKDHEELTSVEIQKIRDAPLVSLDRISEHAINNEVDAIIIAGDVFDKKENTSINLRARTRFTNFLEKLSENDIEVYIALGNHDPIDSIDQLESSWPDNTHVFNADSPHSIVSNINGTKCAIHGASYQAYDESRDLASMYPKKISDAINIGVLHTNVGANTNHTNYAPSNLEKLTSFDYDYFALGHIHKREILNDHPMVAYSGNTQGLSAKPSEQSPKGCILVTIESSGSQEETKFLACDTVRFNQITLELNDIGSAEELSNEIAEQIKRTNTDNVLYLTKVKLRLVLETDNIGAEALRVAINDSRENTIVTSLKIESTNSSWSELVQSDPFFAELEAMVNDTIEIDLDELYATKASNIENILGENTQKTIAKDDIVQHILTVQNQLKKSSR